MFPRPVRCQQNLLCKRFWDRIGKSEWVCLWGSELTLTRVIVTSLVLDGTNAVFVLCFETVFWARRCSMKQQSSLTEGLQKMPLRVMQRDKCDFEVFFNNTAEKCCVIGQSRAGNHWRTESFCLWQLLHTLTNWIKLTTRENRNILIRWCISVWLSHPFNVYWVTSLEFILQLFLFWKTFTVQQVTKGYFHSRRDFVWF